MSLDLDRPKDQPIREVSELEAFFRSAERPSEQHKVGLEHEKLLFAVGGSEPVPYEGDRGVSALLQKLCDAGKGYAPFREHDGAPVIALVNGEFTVSLEPGGQLELSGSPFRTAREAHEENVRHLGDVKAAAAALGLRVVGLGYRPFGSVAQMPWMPKTRYAAMKETLPRRGKLALDMMLMTATVQTSLDWSDEADCAAKVKMAAKVSPIVNAIYANSPIVDGKVAGLLSFRNHVWTDVDPARSGYPRFFVDGSFSYRAYVEWALDAPLLFLRREGRYLAPRLTFRQLLQDGFEGKPAVTADWTDHLSTMFPEVRVKKVIELRGADSGAAEMAGALAALWRGLFYDAQARTDAEKLLGALQYEALLSGHATAAREGLRGRYNGKPLAKLATDLVAIAKDGLARLGGDDAALLEPLAEVSRRAQSPAERVLEAYGRQSSAADFLKPFEL